MAYPNQQYFVRFVFSLASFSLAAVGLVTATGTANAAGMEGFDPNYLISDEAMYGDVADSLSEGEIQVFLDDKGKSCTRGEDGSPCLKNATFDTQSFPASKFCEREFVGEKGDSAARVIAKAAQACRLSPKVLIVLLQKEQGLVTSTNPTARNYARATGFACPDTAPCDSTKAGFATQVYAAAARLQQYKAEPHRFNFAAGRTTTIAYHPNKSCGSTTVTPKSAATAALYNYTPYLPNAAALANPQGTGDSCSAYGNRNFFRLHSDWFEQPNLGEAPAPPDSTPGSDRSNEPQAPTMETPQTEVPKTEVPKPQVPKPQASKNDTPQESEVKVTADNLTIISQNSVKVPSSLDKAFPVGNWDSTGLTDVAVTQSNGQLMLFSHVNTTEYGQDRQIGTGWNIMRTIMGGADFDGDTQADILAVDKSHNMFLYRGKGNGGFGQVTKIGTGWNIFHDILLLSQGPHGKPAVVGSGPGGTYVYATNGRGQWTGRQRATIPSLAGAIAGPDLTGSGYSTIFVPQDEKTVLVYATRNGSSFTKHATITVPFGYRHLLNSAQVAGKSEHIIDIVTSDQKVVALTIRAASAATPPAPPAPSVPAAQTKTYWDYARFSRSAQVGTGWPNTHVYSMGDFNGDGHTDAAIMWSNGDLVLYPSSNRGSSFHTKQRIGTGWNGFADIHTGVDFDGDSRPDVVARAGNGDLWLYPGNGRAGFETLKKIGTGWNMFDTIHVLRRGTNGAPIVYGVSADRIRAYPTNGKGSFQSAGEWRSGYSWMKTAIPSDDWDNDGASDVLYRGADGDLFVGVQTQTGFTNPQERRIGIGWQGFNVLAPAYMDGLHKILWVVAPDAKLRTYQWNAKNAGKFVAPAPVSSHNAAFQLTNRSYRDGAWLKHPIAWKGQPDDETCGPTSMWMVLNYLGAHRSAYDGKPLDVWTLKGRNYANVGTGFSGGTSWEERRLSLGMNRWLGQNVYKQWTFPNGWDFRLKVIDSFKTGRPVVVDTIENYGGPHYNGHVGQSSHIIVATEYHVSQGSVGFVDPGGPGSAISGYSAQRYFRYPSAVDFGNNFLGNYGGGGHGMVY